MQIDQHTREELFQLEFIRQDLVKNSKISSEDSLSIPETMFIVGNAWLDWKRKSTPRISNLEEAKLWSEWWVNNGGSKQEDNFV